MASVQLVKVQLRANVTPRLVLQGCYNQPDNETFEWEMFSITFKPLKATPFIDYR